MSITEEITFGNNGQIERWPWLRKFFLAAVIILTALLSFGIGRLSVVSDREAIKIEYEDLDKAQSTNIQAANAVIGSRNGSKYHFLHCPGAKQIKEANKITFNSPDEAERAGYTKASNCK